MVDKAKLCAGGCMVGHRVWHHVSMPCHMPEIFSSRSNLSKGEYLDNMTFDSIFSHQILKKYPPYPSV